MTTTHILNSDLIKLLLSTNITMWEVGATDAKGLTTTLDVCHFSGILGNNEWHITFDNHLMTTNINLSKPSWQVEH
jgi:hypothetical protein